MGQWRVSREPLRFVAIGTGSAPTYAGDTLLRGTKGVRLPDHAAALRHAQQLARGFKWIRWSIHVIDEQGRAIGTIE
jgi:hypothetical protein